MRNSFEQDQEAIYSRRANRGQQEIGSGLVNNAFYSIAGAVRDAIRALSLLERLGQATLARALRGELITASDGPTAQSKPIRGGL